MNLGMESNSATKKKKKPKMSLRLAPSCNLMDSWFFSGLFWGQLDSSKQENSLYLCFTIKGHQVLIKTLYKKRVALYYQNALLAWHCCWQRSYSFIVQQSVVIFESFALYNINVTHPPKSWVGLAFSLKAPMVYYYN